MSRRVVVRKACGMQAGTLLGLFSVGPDSFRLQGVRWEDGGCVCRSYRCVCVVLWKSLLATPLHTASIMYTASKAS